MQTQEEFAANAREFRERTRVFAIYSVVGLFMFLIGNFILMEFIVRQHILDKNSSWWFVEFGVLAGGLFAISLIQVRFNRAVALRCKLQCPKCLSVAKPIDLKILTATHNCPYCGATFFH